MATPPTREIRTTRLEDVDADACAEELIKRRCYTVAVRGDLPADVCERVSAMHAEALVVSPGDRMNERQ